MKFGALDFMPVREHLGLTADPVARAITAANVTDCYVAGIDPTLSDTAAFCERYQVGMDVSANCVVVEARRADKTWYAACVLLATDRADINGVIRRQLDARKISFASMETAVSLTGMEYGGITPVGLPEAWPLFIDEAVAAAPYVVVGSGIRRSKLLISGAALGKLPRAVVQNIVRQASTA